MPRSNRPRRRRQREEQPDVDLSRALYGFLRQETKRGGVWNVQPVSGESATKDYVCPGCSGTVLSGTPHVVAWRADGLFGEADDLAGRRHWHSRCWTIS